MAAEYDFIKKPSTKEEAENQPLYPRIVSKGTISSKKIVSEIAEASSFTSGDLEGVLCSLSNKIAHYLADGYHVELGDMGFFSASLKARPVMDKKEIRSNSIYFDNVNFRASSQFRKKSFGYLERAKYGFRHSINLPEETRRTRLDRYFGTHPFITRIEYSRISGLLKGKALKELNALITEGYLDTLGRGSHKVYVKAQKA
ncbi:HU family DNA-binding protein [uncultured Bacteroides sp.]|uniref:HU family DNA-binding protein n=1 Tax=uncultured Bacteroides sp. TaxID=162156 RepID=UPI002AA6F8F2|nr:HU family DNA-binding protein [uncultured Bacteroides sp.]